MLAPILKPALVDLVHLWIPLHLLEDNIVFHVPLLICNHIWICKYTINIFVITTQSIYSPKSHFFLPLWLLASYENPKWHHRLFRTIAMALRSTIETIVEKYCSEFWRSYAQLISSSKQTTVYVAWERLLWLDGAYGMPNSDWTFTFLCYFFCFLFVWCVSQRVSFSLFIFCNCYDFEVKI